MLSFVQNLKDFLKGFSLCRSIVHVHTCTRHKHKGPGAYLKARLGPSRVGGVRQSGLAREGQRRAAPAVEGHCQGIPAPASEQGQGAHGRYRSVKIKSKIKQFSSQN